MNGNETKKEIINKDQISSKNETLSKTSKSKPKSKLKSSKSKSKISSQDGKSVKKKKHAVIKEESKNDNQESSPKTLKGLTKSKRTASQNNIILKPKIINELPRSRSVVSGLDPFKKKITTISVTYVFQNRPNNLFLSDTSTFKDLKKRISKNIKMKEEEMKIKCCTTILDSKFDEVKLAAILKQFNYSYFMVKDDSKKSSNKPIQYQMYGNKVILSNVESINDLYQRLSEFFNETKSEKLFQIDPLNDNSYSISFPFPELAFDFRRYMSVLKTKENLYKNIKVNLQIEKVKYYFGKPLNLSHKFTSALYININTPYESKSDRESREYKQNKKKWMNKRGFISCVSSNSKYNNNYIY